MNATTTPTQSLLRRIRKILAGGDDPQAEALAAEFAELCEETNSRLEEVRDLGSEGSAEKAVKKADEEPALIEVLEALGGFHQVGSWNEHCEEQSLPVAKAVDPAELGSLIDRYKSWKGATKFLWKKYRDAAIRKDEGVALGVARRILKTDPSDRSARDEANRILRRHFRSMRRELDELVDSDDRPSAVALVDSLDALPFDDLKKGETWLKAILWRDRQRRATDKKRLAALLAGLDRQKQMRDLDGVKLAVSEIRKIVKTHKMKLTEASAADLDGAKAWIVEDEARRKREAGAKDALKRCEAELGKTNSNWVPLTKGPIRELDGARRKLTNTWKELEKAGGGEALGPKVADLTERLDVVIAKRRAQRRRKVRTTILAILLVSFSIAYYFYAQWRGEVLVDRLAENKRDRQAIVVKKLVRSLDTWRWPIAKLSRIDPHITAAKSWLNREYGHYDEVEGRIVALDEETEEAFGRPIEEYYAEIEDIKVNITQAAYDLQPLLEERMAALNKRWETHVDDYVAEQRRRRTDALAGIKDLFNSLPRLDRAALDDGKFGEVKGLSEELADAMRTVIPPSAPLKPVENEAAESGPKVDDLLRRLEEFRAAVAAADAAENFDQYQRALEMFRDGQFEGTPQRSGATELLAFKKTQSKEIGEIIAPEAPEGWAYFEANRDKEHLFPKSVEDEERNMLENLSAEKELEDLYRCYFQDLATGKSFVSYCKGPTKLRNRRVGPTAIIERSGRFYDEGGVSFRKYEVKEGLGVRMLSERPASETALLRDVKPDEKLLSGSQQYYRTGIFETFDKILAADVHPLFKAYLQIELGKVVANRSGDWGVFLAPELFADLRRLKAASPALLNRTSWMWTGKYPTQEQAIREIYADIGNHRYGFEARVNRRLVEQTLETGFGFAGYVDADGQLVLRAAAEAADSLYGAPKPGALAKLIYRKSEGGGDALLGGGPGGGWTASEGVFEMTPLLYFKGDRAEMLAAVAAAEGVELAKIREVALPFFVEGLPPDEEEEVEGETGGEAPGEEVSPTSP